jgi:hypothetical protein
MQIVTMRRKIKLYASWMLLVCIVMIVGYFVLWKDRNLKVYDDNFKILHYSISRGTIHTMYQGNQTVGRIRDMLRQRFGMKFIGQSNAAMIHAPEGRALLLRYEGDFPIEELEDLRAVLRNDKNISKKLMGINMTAPNERTFVRGYLLPWLSMSEDSFRIELRLKSADDPIACWNVGKLYRHNRRVNSDQ